MKTASGIHLNGCVVVYRKGELSKGTIDREWPHQVALRADRCAGHNYFTIRLFCEAYRCVRAVIPSAATTLT